MRYLLVLLLLGLTACVPGADLAICPESILIKDFAFSPAHCKVKLGSSITFKNDDAVPHTATALFNAPVQFDTGELAAGESATLTFDRAETIPFHCAIHPSMTGSLFVEP